MADVRAERLEEGFRRGVPLPFRPRSLRRMKPLRQPLGLGDVEDREGAQEADLPTPVAVSSSLSASSPSPVTVMRLRSTMAVAFSPLRTNPPSSFVWRKVSQRGKG